MSIRLIAFDLDGTLLDNEKRVPGKNREALKEAADRGIWIVPFTARLSSKVPEEVTAFPFIRYLVTENGARIYDREKRRTVYQADITALEAGELFDYMDGLPVIYDCYQDGTGWIDKDFYEHTERWITDPYTQKLIHTLRLPVDGLRQVISDRNRPIQKTQMFFEDLALRAKVFEELKEKFPLYSVTSSLYNNIEINAENANKGAALTALCRHLGIHRSECIAFGDNGNDVSMLKAAGIGVAMGNATPEAKAAADVITDSNEEGGVGSGIRKYVLQP